MASDLENTLKQAVEQRLETQWAAATAIHWPNQNFDPPSTGEWIEPALIGGDGGYLSGGSGVTGNRIVGVLSVNVFGQPGAGTGRLWELADNVRDIFSRWAAGNNIFFGVPSAPREVRNPARPQVVVTIPFQGREA